MDISASLSIGAAVAGGGGLTVWFSKASMQRLIAQYDERHRSHDTKIEKITRDFVEAVDKLRDGLTGIREKLAALEVRAAEVVAVRDDVRDMTRRLAVVESVVEKTKEDTNKAWSEIKKIRLRPVTIPGK